jgi:tRNA nucleotidyltransferase (CCA-adding enzyme)
MKIAIPHDVKTIMDELYKHGYEAFIVGGCVRDSLLGVSPKDWDITTNATPNDMRMVFNDYYVIPTGEKYGTMTVLLNDIPYEVTTYRADGNYSDGRRPDEVTFSNTLEEDLNRRDFTINAMAYNDVIGLVDYFGGYKDLNNKTIKCVGKSEDRFTEDALRIMRAVRFAVVYSLSFSSSFRCKEISQT